MTTIEELDALIERALLPGADRQELRDALSRARTELARLRPETHSIRSATRAARLEGYQAGFGHDRFTVYTGGYKGQYRLVVRISWALLSPYAVFVSDQHGNELERWTDDQAQGPEGGYMSLFDVLERLGFGREVSIPPWLAFTVRNGIQEGPL